MSIQVYDFVFDKERSKWTPWMDTVASKPLDVESEYTTIIVPTVDTVRYTYLLHKFVTHGMHCLFVGPTGESQSRLCSVLAMQNKLPCFIALLRVLFLVPDFHLTLCLIVSCP